jgi:hypothetical protein
MTLRPARTIRKEMPKNYRSVQKKKKESLAAYAVLSSKVSSCTAADGFQVRHPFLPLSRRVQNAGITEQGRRISLVTDASVEGGCGENGPGGIAHGRPISKHPT